MEDDDCIIISPDPLSWRCHASEYCILGIDRCDRFIKKETDPNYADPNPLDFIAVNLPVAPHEQPYCEEADSGDEEEALMEAHFLKTCHFDPSKILEQEERIADQEQLSRDVKATIADFKHMVNELVAICPQPKGRGVRNWTILRDNLITILHSQVSRKSLLAALNEYKTQFTAESKAAIDAVLDSLTEDDFPPRPPKMLPREKRAFPV